MALLTVMAEALACLGGGDAGGRYKLHPGLDFLTLEAACDKAGIVARKGDMEAVIYDVLAWVEKNGPKFRSADSCARMLGVYADERDRLKITTVGATDQLRQERIDWRRKRNVESKTKARRAKGAVPRQIYLQNSASQLMPWEAFGVSRRTWERWGKPTPWVATQPADVTQDEQ